MTHYGEGNLNSGFWWAEFEISVMIAMRCMIADPYRQQIRPLRCAPVGMTHYGEGNVGMTHYAEQRILNSRH
jgi:hypothetical protein